MITNTERAEALREAIKVLRSRPLSREGYRAVMDYEIQLVKLELEIENGAE